MDCETRKRVYAYYERQHAQDFEKMFPRFSFNINNVFTKLKPNPSQYLSCGGLELLKELGPFDHNTHGGLGKMRRKVFLVTHPDKRRQESIYHQEFSKYFQALESYLNSTQTLQNGLKQPQNQFQQFEYTDTVQPEDVQDVVQPEDVQDVVQPEDVQDVVQPEDVQDVVQPEEMIQLKNDHKDFQSEEKIHLEDVQPLIVETSHSHQLESFKEKKEYMEIPPLEEVPNYEDLIVSPQVKHHSKSKRKSRDGNDSSLSSKRQKHPLQLEHEFFIDQLCQLASNTKTKQLQLAILIALVCLKSNSCDPIKIDQVRKGMKQFPFVLTSRDYSHIADPKKREGIEKHYIRNPNQSLKEYMKKNGNMITLMDRIVLQLHIGMKKTREQISYSVKIKSL
jgi:hypothetical protein